jgi:hypothetical protein
MNRMNTMKHTCGLLLTGAAVWLAAAGTAHAQRMVKTVTYVCRGAEVQDTYLITLAGGTPPPYEYRNNGASTRLDANGDARVSLLRFDLRALAGQYSSIERLTLTFKESSAQPSSAGTGTVFRIRPVNKAWVEGTGSGSAVEGAPCWSNLAYSASVPSRVLWAGSPGLSTAGTDYETAALGAFAHATNDLWQYSVNLAGGDAARRKSLADEWSGSQADNAGVVLRQTRTGGSLYLFSNNDGTAANQPTLTVEYVPAGPPVAVFRAGADGYAGAEDTTLKAYAPVAYTNNYGKASNLQIYRYETIGPAVLPLLRFDLSALSPRLYAGIEGLVLTNFVYNSISYGTGGTVTAYSVLPANGDWVEGTGIGQAVAGAPCWSYRAWSAASPTPWAGSAGLSTAGTDYDAAALGSFTAANTNQGYNYGLTLAASDPARRQALVNAWSGPRAGNPGLLLRMSGGVPSDNNVGLDVCSGDHAVSANRPTLEVAYTATETKTATFRNGVNGYAGMQDTCVQNYPGREYINYGKSPQVDLHNSGNTRKGLMRFDLSSLRGRYAAVRRLRLTLTDSDVALETATFSGTLRAYRVKAANKGWVEGTATGIYGAVKDGESCWSNKVHSTTSPVPWAGSPGLATAGTDYDAVELGAFTGLLSMGGSLTLELGNAKALVDEWSGSQADNAGILLVADAANLYGCSSDHATVSNRPLLEVEYVPVKGTLIRVY